MNILEALDDPEVFGPHFRKRSWKPWRGFLAALFALPSDMSIEAFKAATGRSTWPQSPFAEAALVVGRRGGKSRILALIAVYLACFRDYAPYLAAGEVATVAILAANRPQARTIFRYIEGLLKAVPLLTPMLVDKTAESIILNNRVVIEIGTASFRTTRGYTFAAVLCDEIAFWRFDENSANPDVEILRALRPGMASIPGAILLLASSPYAKKGALYEALRKYFGDDAARVLVWKAPTWVMNPSIPQDIIDEAYEADPESAKAEYGAEPRDDLADFVTREIVDAVTCWGRRELPPEDGVAYHAFCDPSGGVSDSMTLAIGHLRDGEVCVLDAVLEVRPPFNPDVAVMECVTLLKRFGVTRVIGDRYAGEWPKARFAEHGITFEQSARPKSDIYHDLLPLLNAKRVELLEHPRLAAQLVGLERRTSRSGRDSIDHSPGGHDDLVNSAAGVLVGLDLDRRVSLVSKSAIGVSEAYAFPIGPRWLMAVLAADKRGFIGIIYAARTNAAPALLLLDFDLEPLQAGLFGRIAARLDELTKQARPQASMRSMAFAAADLARHANAGGLLTEPIPDWIVPENLMLSASGHVAADRVRLCEPVLRKSETLPFAGALDFRGGDTLDDPLRRAAVLTIALALDPQSPNPQATFQGIAA